MSTSRAAIEMLMPAFHFDGVESAGKIKFVKRGGASVATLTEDDAVVADGRPALETLRGKETELPNEVAVKFIDAGRDHEINSLYARRLTGNSLNVQTLEFPIVMSADKAQQVAEINLFSAWWGRQQTGMTSNWGALKLEPTDLVTWSKTGLPSQSMRVVKKDVGANGEIKLEMVRDEASVYTSTATGTSGDYTGQDVAYVKHSALYVLDMPLLRDQDDGYGYYMTAAGYVSSWPGCVVYRSLDAGVIYGAIETFTTAATVGASSTALGDFLGGNVFDEINVVRVNLLMSGTLASATEAQVLAGANTAYLGSEVIQFRTATLVSAGIYDLSGLLRGRRGTDWAMASHTSGERFVLASASTWSREVLQSADIGREVFFKPVSFGSGQADTTAQSMTFAALCLKPYSPVQPGVGRDGSGNITITWIRQTRVGGAWVDYADAQIGEDSELYDIEIYSSNTYATVTRTFSDQTSQTVSYTSAQQVTDFGSNQSTIYFKVYQKSAQFGRGYALTSQG